MNCTNFTAEKPVYKCVSICKQSGDSTFGSGRDIAYLVFSILQFLIAVVGLVWVNRFIRNKDRKEERERQEKGERDKIADIIDEVNNKIVENGIGENLRKLKEKFENMVMFHSSGEPKITGLEVLRFMLLDPENFKSEPLTKLQQDLNAVVRQFPSLCFKLPLKDDCPKNIKKGLGPLITVMEAARSFVPAKERYTITKVLKYFGNVQEVDSEENEKKNDENHSKRIRRFFPYVDFLRLGKPEVDEYFFFLLPFYDDQDFSFDIYRLPDTERMGITPDLESIEFPLRKNKTEDLRKFTNKIDEIWRQRFQLQNTDIPEPDWSKEEHVRANILHAVRVFMLDAAKGITHADDEKLKELVGEMKNELTYDSKAQIGIVDMAIAGIQNLKRYMHRFDESQLKSAADILNRAYEEICDNCNIYYQRNANSNAGASGSGNNANNESSV